MMALRSWVLASAVVASACTVDQVTFSTQAIVGGETSGPSEFLATGMLTARDRLVCTATLIAPDVALTAAHCLREPAFGSFGFTLDTDESDGTSEVVPVLFTHQHPDFDEGVDEFVDLSERNDIGIIILEHPILNVVPEEIDKAAYGTPVDPGAELALCGYGRPDWYIGTAALKRDAKVIVDRTDYFEFSTMADGPQPCNGDSGAPLLIDTPNGRRLVGVVSRAMGRSMMCDTGAIVTRVSQYAAWINKASKDRDRGLCSAGGGSSFAPLLVVAALVVRRRRRPSA
jgi:protease YdgD